MRFTKMHGAGNDYVYVNGFEEVVENAPAVARRISHRRFGVGSDGLILIQPPRSRDADCRMEMYNADGSRAQMCGNGIRCVAKYVYEHGIARQKEIRVETDVGPKTVRVFTDDTGETVAEAEVDMGPPALERAAIPFTDGGDPRKPAMNVPTAILGRTFRLTAVSMGNPHAVLRWDSPAEVSGERLSSLANLPLGEWGPHFEHHPWFPERTNTEFMVLRSPREMDLRVWERGSGETFACGTGACAAVVAGVLNGWCEREVVVHLRGGDLRVRWEEGGRGAVYLTGPAVQVFKGEWD
jgi:diaminopimelate epimerase